MVISNYFKALVDCPDGGLRPLADFLLHCEGSGHALAADWSLRSEFSLAAGVVDKTLNRSIHNLEEPIVFFHLIPIGLADKAHRHIVLGLFVLAYERVFFVLKVMLETLDVLAHVASASEHHLEQTNEHIFVGNRLLKHCLRGSLLCIGHIIIRSKE